MEEKLKELDEAIIDHIVFFAMNFAALGEVQTGRNSQQTKDCIKNLKQDFRDAGWIEPCELCYGSKQILKTPKRTMGYTLTPGETLDEHLVPCPRCTLEPQQPAPEREKILRKVLGEWDRLFRHKGWEEAIPCSLEESDNNFREAMRQFDQYIQSLTLPLRFNDKFPPKTEIEPQQPDKCLEQRINRIFDDNTRDAECCEACIPIEYYEQVKAEILALLQPQQEPQAEYQDLRRDRWMKN